MGEQLNTYKRGELTIYHLILRYKRISPFFLHWGMFNQLIDFKKSVLAWLVATRWFLMLFGIEKKTVNYQTENKKRKKSAGRTIPWKLRWCSISFTMNMEVNLVSWWKIENSTLFLVYEKWVLHNTANKL